MLKAIKVDKEVLLMSKTGKKILTAFILMVCLAVGAVAVYYYISRPDSSNAQEGTETTGTEIEKLLNKDLDTKYPETPVEVLKLYWRFNKCMYNEKMSDSEFEKLLEQLRKLYDEEFLSHEDNSWENMLDSFKKDREEYMENSKKISIYTVGQGSSAVSGKIDGRETVSITCNALIKQKAERINVYEEFMCRRDNDNKWKILGWKKTDAEDSQQDDGN